MSSMSLGRVLAVLLFVLLSSVAAAKPPLRLVSDVWPPFTDVAGKPREALDLVEGALRRGGVQSQSSIMTWSEAYAALKAGKFAGSAAMWKTPEREEFLLFSEPYLENRLVLVARKGAKVTQRSIDELAGMRLALTRDYGYGDAIANVQHVTIVYKDSDAACLRAVLANEADYLLLDELMVHHLFELYPDRANRLIAAGPFALVKRPLYFTLRKDYPGAEKIIADFNKNVQRMVSDGTYNVVLHVPWISADVDGDGKPELVGSRKTAVKGTGDPIASPVGYALFLPDPHRANPAGPPGYVIDGKSYNTWGDAATTLQRTKREGAYKYATGVVLFEF